MERKPKLFVIIYFLLITTVGFAQQEENKTEDPFAVVQIEAKKLTPDELCGIIQDRNTEIAKDLLIGGKYISKGWLAYRHKETWFEFDLENPANNARFQFFDIDKDNNQELAVFSRNDQYGSGGGTSDSRVTVYKFDTMVWKILDFNYASSEEMFGREYNDGANYFHQCIQEVTPDYGEIRIAPVSNAGSYDHGIAPDKETCLDFIAPGIYTFRGGKIQKTGKYSRKKRNSRLSH